METQVMDNQVSTNDTEPQVTDTKPAENNVDLSAYFKDGEAGVFDEKRDTGISVHRVSGFRKDDIHTGHARERGLSDRRAHAFPGL